MSALGGKRALTARLLGPLTGRKRRAVTRYAFFAALLVGSNLLAPSKALACRGVDPSELRDVDADAAILTQITSVNLTAERAWRRWEATATKRHDAFGSVTGGDFKFADSGAGSCGPGQPSLNEYWVLYLKKEGENFRVGPAWPFWWARASEDRRLKRLNTLLPLGIVRTPTAAEGKILDRIEKTLRPPNGVREISNYTRVYSRSSPGSLRAKFLRSRTPRRLVADISEEGPTRASCKCDLKTLFTDVEDLRLWGK